jgi:hypothetical protein
LSRVVRKPASRNRMLDRGSGVFAQLDRRLFAYAIFHRMSVADFCGIPRGRGG